MAKRIINTNLTLILLVVIGLMAHSLFVKAGNLEPSSGPGPTMKTLNEIYSSVNALGVQAPDETFDGLSYVEKLKLDILAGGDSMGPPGPFLKLEIDGNDVRGESTIASMDRGDSIQCQAFDHEMRVPYDPETFAIQGREIHGAVTILKPTDRSSPAIYKALCNNEPVTRAEFRFFRPTHVGGEEHYSTVFLENGYIVGVRRSFQNLERVTFIYQDITWTYETTGAQHRESIVR